MTKDLWRPTARRYSAATQYASPLVLLACLLWCIFCIIAFSNAGSNVFLAVVAMYIAAGWSLIWLLRLIVYWRRSGHRAHNHPLGYWLLEPVSIITPLALAFLGAFSLVRFALSEPELTSYVEKVRSGKVELGFEFQHPPRQVGLYTVTYTDSLPDGTVRLITSSHGLSDKAGFANSPNNPPLRQGEDSYKHIHQQWWYWYESW